MSPQLLASTLPNRTESWFLVGCPKCKTVSGMIFFPSGNVEHVNCGWKGKAEELWERLPDAAKALQPQ